MAAVVAARPGREFRVEADFFVIATGGLETARLLLESERYRGTGTPSLVGHYYMTHLDGVAGSLRFDCTAPRAAYRYEVTRDGVYCRRLVCLTPEAKRAGGLLNFGAVLYVPSPEDPAHGDGLLSSFALAKDAMQRTKAGFKSRRHAMDHSEPLDYSKHLANVARNPWALPRFSVEWTRKRWLASRKLPSFLMQPASGEYRLLFSAEQSPAYANRVELSDQWDAFGLPRLKVLWSVKEQDYESILRSLQIVARNIRALGFGHRRHAGKRRRSPSRDRWRFLRRHARDGNRVDERLTEGRRCRRDVPSSRCRQSLRREQRGVPDRWLRPTDADDRGAVDQGRRHDLHAHESGFVACAGERCCVRAGQDAGGADG